MTTPGNLEMRIGNSTLIASTKSDGYDIYKIIPMLADSFDERMTPEKLKRWFKKSARDIINGVCDVRMGGIAKEVIIDIDRRLILHNGDDEDYNIISIQTGSKFSYELVKAVQKLREEYDFQVFNYRNWKVQQLMGKLGYERKHWGKHGK